MKVYKYYIALIPLIAVFLLFTASGRNSAPVKHIFNVSEMQKDTLKNSDIIKFNHKLHVKDLEVACDVCHGAALKSASSTDNLMPGKPVCAECHDVKDEKQCSLCHFDGVNVKLRHTQKELNFSHKFHIEKGQKCQECHKNTDIGTYASTTPGSMPYMETCYKCHDSKVATNSCEGCHTNLTNLKPSSHLSANFLNEHKAAAYNQNCMMCHSESFCTVCHSPSAYKGSNTKTDFFAPYWTKGTGTRTDRAELQKLDNVHNLNYIYTHGLDATQKSFECKTCHDPVSFCGSCHQDGGNISSGILQKTHLQPNFKTIGVNSGGGLHAELARKDIEACEACHSVNGADPVCIKCHFDNDGVRGTNPKTHESGFMQDVHGTWHNTKGAICYSCHTDATASPNGTPGVGFCGYCHSRK
jgi:hypothetical protein